MLFRKQPSDMTEEKAPLRIVWVGVSFRELVVQSVVPAPGVHVVLSGNRLADHEEDSQGNCRLVGAMRPEAMGSARDANQTQNAIPVT